MGAEEQREQKFNRMTQTPIPKLICQLAVPTIISMLVTSFYNMADTFFVGKINTSATAAVGVVFPLMAIIQAFGFFCGHGSGNYISRQLGAQNFEDASRMSATGFCHRLCAGAVHPRGRLCLHRPAVIHHGLHRDHPALRAGLYAHHPAGRAVHDRLAGAQ